MQRGQGRQARCKYPSKHVVERTMEKVVDSGKKEERPKTGVQFAELRSGRVTNNSNS